jgi:hypothetical protein
VWKTFAVVLLTTAVLAGTAGARGGAGGGGMGGGMGPGWGIDYGQSAPGNDVKRVVKRTHTAKWVRHKRKYVATH